MMQRAESKTASTVIGYSQKFGRIARGGKDKPVIINVDENGKVSLAMCETCMDRYIPDCDNPNDKLCNLDIVLPDTDDPDRPSWNGAVFNGNEWVRTAPHGRAARHSLNDGNRDSRWAGADRKAMKAIKKLNDKVKFAMLDFVSEYDIVLAWIGISAILSAFVLAILGVLN